MPPAGPASLITRAIADSRKAWKGASSCGCRFPTLARARRNGRPHTQTHTSTHAHTHTHTRVHKHEGRCQRTGIEYGLRACEPTSPHCRNAQLVYGRRKINCNGRARRLPLSPEFNVDSQRTCAGVKRDHFLRKRKSPHLNIELGGEGPSGVPSPVAIYFPPTVPPAGSSLDPNGTSMRWRPLRIFAASAVVLGMCETECL